jgi:hypothetical protein
MANGERRTVKRTIKRDTATRIRRRLENAQDVVRRPQGVSEPHARRIERARAQQLLDAHEVSVYDTITQARHRFGGWWRVFAAPAD